VKKIIVTTTINPPTEAIRLFDSIKDWELLVVGDLKTPANYELERGFYLSPTFQELKYKKLSDSIGWNCIQRRNIGIVYALELGADVVALVDDDNIPLNDEWGQLLIGGGDVPINYFSNSNLAFDPISVTDYPELWHRGFPIQELRNRTENVPAIKLMNAQVQADFWQGDPDIDAICRFEHAPDCNFSSDVFPFSSNRFSPFNSQNTFFLREVLKDYFLFPGIGRMDDIWASYYVQSLGHKVVYGKPSVVQVRNPHDVTIDFEREVIGYLNNQKLLKALRDSPDRIKEFLPESTWASFMLYKEITSNA
jgi:hypothetical protein